MILNNKGEVYSFGDNSCGQLGLGLFNIQRLYKKNTFLNLSKLNNDEINDSLKKYILDKSKKNNQYFLPYISNDDDDDEDSNKIKYIYQPLPITETLRNYSNNKYIKIKSIACGDDHSMIITEAGEVYSFGDNQAGNLGLEPKFPNLISLISPKIIAGTGSPEYGKITCASVGKDHSLILNKIGHVFSFGDANYGKSGIIFDDDDINFPEHELKKINLDFSEEEKEEKIINSDYIIRNNTLFKDFQITIDNLHSYCKASKYIYIKNIENGKEIFIYNNDDDDGKNIFERTPILNGGNVKSSRELGLEIIINKNKLELKINNDSLGKGQFEIKFYNYGFDKIDSIDIKTNEYNETIDQFFNTFDEVKKIYNNINDKINEINKLISKEKDNEEEEDDDDDDDDDDDEEDDQEGKYDQEGKEEEVEDEDEDEEKDELQELIKFYNELNDFGNIDIIEETTNKLKESLNFQINETYFDKSKFNINYLEKYYEISDNFKSLLISSINEKELLEKSKINKLLINSFNEELNCKSNIIDFELNDNFKKFIKNISDLKKLDAVESVDIGNEINNYINLNVNQNYLLSPAYQDFYYYFRYHILEDRIMKYNNINDGNEKNTKKK